MYSTPTVPCEKSKIISFASSIMKKKSYLNFLLKLDLMEN